MATPRDFEVTRLIPRGSSEPYKIPSTSGEGSAYTGEIHINHYKSDLVSSSVGIFLRVGLSDEELDTDSIIRIGPAYVTDSSIALNNPGITFTNNPSKYDETGQIWYRKTDKAFFLNDGDVWQRLTPVVATQLVPGIIRISTSNEVLAGLSPDTAVTPFSLDLWREENEFLQRKRTGIQYYVDQEYGTDDISNEGKDPYSPFLTPERALLQMAIDSYLPGSNNDLYDSATINLAPGDYTLDNRPGASNFRTLLRLDPGSTGPLLPYQVPAPISEYSVENQRIRILNATSHGIRIGQELYSSGGGVAIVKDITSNFIFLRRVRGLWQVGQTISYANLSLFNSPTGGVIVPRGCSIVATDLRKTKIRPLYVGDLSTATADPDCGGAGRTSFFKLTGGCYIYGFTFTDSSIFFRSHHLCTCVEFASTADLEDSSYSLYKKVYQVFGKTVTPEIEEADFEAVLAETEIVTSTLNNTDIDGQGYLVVDSVVSSSPYVYNCSVRSRFGLNGMRIDGNKVTGLKSMVTAQFTNVSLQSDPDAFIEDTNVPGNKRYKPGWAHTAFKAINDGYAQIVSCFVISAANHYEAIDGGELSITNSCSNFGEYSLVAKGFTSVALPQDSGAYVRNINPPKPIDPTVLVVPAFTLLAGPSVPGRVYVNGELDEERINPFKFLPGERIYVKAANGTEYSATLSTVQPLIGQDSNGWFFYTSPVDNEIVTNKSQLEDFIIYIKRVPDFRDPDDRIYWIRLEGLNFSNLRRPVENYIFRLDFNREGAQLQTTTFVAKVRSTDTDGTPLEPGIYEIALLSANGVNERLDDLYPELNVDQPVENSGTSLTYIATAAFLRDIGFTTTQITDFLQVSFDLLPLNRTVYVQFNRPSLIRCSGHTWEWQGYLNYSSALPKFQDKVLSFQDSIARIKDQTFGGRVYNTGMDQDGNYIIGDKLIDLKTGEEINISKKFTENTKVYERLTVTKKLLVFPGASLDIRSSIISIDSQTRFASEIPANNGYKTYATKASGGFIEIAEESEALAGLDDLRAVTPSSLKAVIGALKDVYEISFTTALLTAANAEIEELQADEATIQDLTAVDASITNLTATNASLVNLEVAGVISGLPTFSPEFYTNFRNGSKALPGIVRYATTDIIRSVDSLTPDPNVDNRAVTPLELANELAYRINQKGLQRVDSLTFASINNAVKSVANLKLSLSGGNPLPSGYSAASSTLWLWPWNGNEIALYDSTRLAWVTLPRSEGIQGFSIAGLAANTTYDIYIYNVGTDSAPTFELEYIAWPSITVPPARPLFQGVFVKGLDPVGLSRRFLGSIRTTALGTSENSLGGSISPAFSGSFPKLLLSNFYDPQEVVARYDFDGGWEDETASFGWAVPPNYPVAPRITTLNCVERKIEVFYSIYNNSTNGTVYVGLSLNTPPNPDVAAGTTPEITGMNMSTAGKWSRVLFGTNEMYYIYRYNIAGSGGIEDPINEHLGHGMILTTKV